MIGRAGRSTVNRWIRDGYRMECGCTVRLRVAYRGRVRITRRAWIADFLDACSDRETTA